jgi:hypothetical protein
MTHAIQMIAALMVLGIQVGPTPEPTTRQPSSS